MLRREEIRKRVEEERRRGEVGGEGEGEDA